MTDISSGSALAGWAAACACLPLSDQLTVAASAALGDTMACIVAGAMAPETVALRRALPVVSAADQAMVLGTAAHALDFDDNFGPALTHASAVLVPALLSLAAAEGLDGAAVLRSWVIGLELQALIGRAVQPQHYGLGWHSTATVGVLGAAGAAAAMIDGRAPVIAAAMGIAASMAGGSKQQFGTGMKPVHAGLAARNAVQAALLARAGLDAADPFAGPWGFAGLFAPGLQGSGLPEAAAPGTAPVHAVTGVLAKRFACCGAVHRSLDGLALLRADLPPDTDVAGIELHLPALARANLRYDRPQTPAEARFSATFCAAELMLTGQAGLASFTPQRLADPVLQAWLAKVSVVTDESIEITPEGGFVALSRLHLTDGSRREIQVAEPRGSAALPFTAAEQRAKLNDCCAWVGRPALADPMAVALAEFATTGDPAHLIALSGALTPPKNQ